jgi:hypothetical protein
MSTQISQTRNVQVDAGYRADVVNVKDEKITELKKELEFSHFGKWVGAGLLGLGVTGLGVGLAVAGALPGVVLALPSLITGYLAFRAQSQNIPNIKNEILRLEAISPAEYAVEISA